MATAHEWIAYDIAAQKVLGEMIGQCGYSYRQFAELSNGSMSYNRVRDIELGRRAPVKLSEFLLICDVCHADPVATLRQIIADAERLSTDSGVVEDFKDESASTPAGERSPASDVSSDVSSLADAIAAHPEDIDLDAWADRIKAEDSVKSAQ